MRLSPPFTLRAPGKMFILGEYAALDTQEAIVAAVDRGVEVRVQPQPALTWEVPEDDRFVRAALASCPEARGRLSFSDWNPCALADKPGFGGSAAATVAALAAGLRLSGHSWEDLEAQALRTHRAVQGGGSGLDVRASVQGGLRRYRPAGASQELPPQSLLAVYSGRSARTGPRTQRYLAWSSRDAFVRRSLELLDAFPQQPLETLTEAYRLLQDMARQAGLDYDTPALQRAHRLARELGGAAKPSGAGGGDIAVAMVPDPEAREVFRQRCLAEGLQPLEVRLVPEIQIDTSETVSKP